MSVGAYEERKEFFPPVPEAALPQQRAKGWFLSQCEAVAHGLAQTLQVIEMHASVPRSYPLPPFAGATCG